MKKGPPDHTGYERKGNGGVVMQSLSEVKAGAVCTIKWMFGNPQVMEFMHQHDIREGSTINVFQHGRDSMIMRSGSRCDAGRKNNRTDKQSRP